MEVALLTVGDELLSGDTVNTNANWLAGQLTDRGVRVARILSVADEKHEIARHVEQYSTEFDRVIVTGGIGGTPDDVTMEAVADAFDRELAATELTRQSVDQRLADIEARMPDRELALDREAEAAIPEGSRPLINDTGLAPGCVIENVYVLPGIPSELKAMFETIAAEFNGNRQSTFLYTVEPEANIIPALEATMEQFAVTVGCYPDREADHNRLKLTATDGSALQEATDWLLSEINASNTPVSRDWSTDDGPK